MNLFNLSKNMKSEQHSLIEARNLWSKRRDFWVFKNVWNKKCAASDPILFKCSKLPFTAGAPTAWYCYEPNICAIYDEKPFIVTDSAKESRFRIPYRADGTYKFRNWIWIFSRRNATASRIKTAKGNLDSKEPDHFRIA